MNGNQLGHAATLHICAANGVARCFGRHHPDIQVSARTHQTVVHIEAVCEYQRGTLLDVGLDVVAINCCNMLVRQQNHHHVGSLDRSRDFNHFEAGLSNLGTGRSTFAQSNHNFDTAVVEILGVRMTLAAVTDDGNGLAFDETQITVSVSYTHLTLPT